MINEIFNIYDLIKRSLNEFFWSPLQLFNTIFITLLNFTTICISSLISNTKKTNSAISLDILFSCKLCIYNEMIPDVETIVHRLALYAIAQPISSVWSNF